MKGTNIYFTAQENFTKLSVAVPIVTQDAVTVARVFFENVILRYGVPIRVHSDQGSQFQSALFLELCRLMNVKKTKTSPFFPQGNGQIEKWHFNLHNLLAKSVKKSQKNWHELVPLVAFAYNSTEHEATKMTPHSLVYGFELLAPVDVIYGCAPGESYESTSEYALVLCERMREAYALVREYCRAATRRRKMKHDFDGHFPKFEEGDAVWYFYPRRFNGLNQKWRLLWDGPYSVIEWIGGIRR